MSPIAFSGGLQQKKKSELQDLAVALKISHEGTRELLYTRIKEYLDDNQAKLEDDPKFAGLYVRRRRSVQPPSDKPPRATSSAEDSDAKSIAVKPRKNPALGTIRESTPSSELRDVSVYLKKAPLSPPQETPSNTALRSGSEWESSSIPSTSPLLKRSQKSVQHMQTAPQQRAALFRQDRLLDDGAEMLFALRAFLSNSRNVWSLTAVFELMLIITAVIPWRIFRVPLIPKSEMALHLYYPPLEIFGTRAFWLVLLHWFIPTLLVPAIFGHLVSFAPAARGTSNPRLSASRTIPFDPLTASIVRLAAQIIYPYTAVEAKNEVLGLDVLGLKLRALNASVGSALAFAEAIASAPGASIRVFLEAQQKDMVDVKTPSHATSHKGVTIDETLVEVDK